MSRPRKSPTHLVWIDLEMTGLDPAREHIIEIATVVTDKNLKVIGRGPRFAIRQSAKVLDAMDDWNQRQHRKSGLLAEVKKSKVSVRQAEQKTLAFLSRFCEPGRSALCGSSVHHDKSFLVRHMPRLARFLHYRIVDVSSFRIVLENRFPGGPRFTGKKETHRALADILESISELKFFIRHYLKKPHEV
ncbi:MAG: oligoribonuclease [Candidatus Omnitrophica bacterium]|nr:oligoribonuclease [Candidatus Omnitrophota bacterium]